MGSLWGTFLWNVLMGRTRSSLRELNSVVLAGFPSGDFSSQEQTRIENWRCGALCLGPVCRLSGRCWYADSPEGLDLLWAVERNKALDFQVYLLCKGDPSSPLEPTLAPVRQRRRLYLLKAVWAVTDCQVKFWQGRRHWSFYTVSLVSPRPVIFALVCRAKTYLWCEERHSKLHALRVFFSKNTKYLITNLSS